MTMRFYLFHTLHQHLQRKRRGNYLFHEPVVRYCLVAMALLAVYAPMNVLDQWPILLLFTSIMAAIFPPISEYAARSEFPQVMTLYMSLSWLTAPIHGYYFWKEYKTDAANWAIRFKDRVSWPRREKIKGAICLLILPPMLYYVTFFATGHDFNLLPINTSRYMLGLCGWLFAGGVPAVLGVYWYIQLNQFRKLRQLQARPNSP